MGSSIAAASFDRLWDVCGRQVISATERVGRSGWYILGPEVEAFEKSLQSICGSDFVIGCGNGMDAIEIALRSLKLNVGDRVLTSPLSAFPTALAILRAGGEPVYCDVDRHGLIDPEAVQACLEQNPDIRFLLPVHLYGHMADMQWLSRIAERYGVSLVEDAAQAIGATRDGQRVGACSRIACYSFYPTKNLGAIGDAGALATNESGLDKAARALRDYGQTGKYIHSILGLNSRLDEVHAAILREAFMPALDGWTSRRRAIAGRYLSEVRHPDITLMAGPDEQGGVWHLFPVLVSEERQKEFMEHLRSHSIQPGQHYPTLIPDQPAMLSRSQPPQTFGELKVARNIVRREVSLPLHPFLTEAEVDAVIKAVNCWRI